ncbi:Ser/Thr protein kinase RdoA involved in Cpx stress response, MazF antagonist [Mariprofundus ferrinatatus]|uniref:Stress response kinase A n=1 Tax=Mariprofundus ferrinatatus TaxID=1921087 RepID=A0A2K8L6J6_9PROT|nr:serine/threonine protein kinase [Mariprofundus ferrinatatus]ATX82853.1 Ser/Thr protein kinase RdoA involved in Cpx stress response, MazF antagonist [Mariprofundus ferrinatatus]
MKKQDRHSFYRLGPEQILQAVESVGFECDGQLLALNSYENRVYLVGAGRESIVVKFYRPNRWSDSEILEEHLFTEELAEFDIPAVPPLSIKGSTLFHHDGHRFAFYPLKAGRAPDLESREQLEQLGRYIGRIHAVGAVRDFEHRPTLDVGTFGDDSYEFLIENGFIPKELEAAYEKVAEDLLHAVEARFESINPQLIRLHGDGHQGNILWDVSGDGAGSPYIIDFDDARMGPAIQDLWMFLSGDRANMSSSLDILLTAYDQFHDFDCRELALIEPLRSLRIMHHAAWLARRWDDPAFKDAFPWFNTQNYWEQHVLSLKEQMAAMQEPPLVWI